MASLAFSESLSGRGRAVVRGLLDRALRGAFGVERAGDDR